MGIGQQSLGSSASGRQLKILLDKYPTLFCYTSSVNEIFMSLSLHIRYTMTQFNISMALYNFCR